MAEEKRFTKATWQIMEQLLEVDSLEDALSGSLEIIVETLNSEAGAIWFLDPKTDRLSPLFHIGPADLSNLSVENGLGPEGIVTKTGKSIRVEDAASDPRFDGSVFDDNGLITRTMICVPLNTLHDVIGCVQIVNKKDGSLYDAEELKLCERMAALAAITIEEKGLLVDLGEQKEVLAVMKDVTKEFPSGDTWYVLVLPAAFDQEALDGCAMKVELAIEKSPVPTATPRAIWPRSPQSRRGWRRWRRPTPPVATLWYGNSPGSGSTRVSGSWTKPER